MLKVLFGDKATNCAGMTRRSALQVGSLGFGGLTLPNLLSARAAGSPEISRDTSVVWLWLNGGPTHIETFDPKMTAPKEYRSVSGEVKTRLPGVTLGGHFEGMAQQADRMTFVRSFVVPTSSHNRGAFWVNTGYKQGSNRPSLGSITSRVRGANHPVSGMPTYLQMGKIGFNTDAPIIPGPAWLGKAYGPFTPSGPSRENMNLTTEVSRLEDRRSLLKGLDKLQRDVDANGVMDGIDGMNHKAFSLIMGKATQAFDLKREDPRTVDKYGGGLGQSLLTARRLCEVGCGFVAVSLQGWDMHGNVAGGMNSRGPQVDRAVSAFVSDIHQRGLDKNILLVISGEFGRTPRINKNAGRDHWGPLSTLALAGGGLNMGQVIGKSSAKAEVPAGGKVGPQQLMATIFHGLGIERETSFDDPAGRPIPMLGTGQPIRGLI